MKRFSRRNFLKSAIQKSSSLVLAGTIPAGLAYCSSDKTKEKTATGIPAASKNGKLGIALAGIGRYSRGQLAPALQETGHCYLAGIITGTPEKEEVWAAKYDIPQKNIYNYGNISEVANNTDIDIVYIVLPNAMHAEYAIKAAEAGKHVICEKPLTTHAENAQKIIDACKANNVKLSVGYRLHFEPHNLEMMRIGQKQVYGQVKKLEAGFGFNAGNPYVWRKDKFMAGGGPLLDLGIYCLQGVIYTMGAMPQTVKASHKQMQSRAFHDVEAETEWTFTFPSGATAKCYTSYIRPMSYLKAETEQGIIKLEPAFYYGGIKGKTPDGHMDMQNVNQQARQMDDFALHIKNNTATPVPGEMGMRDIELIEAIYESARNKGKEIAVKTTFSTLHQVE